MVSGWHVWYNDGIRKHPENVCETEFSNDVAFKTGTVIANFIIPMTLMVVIYYKIFVEIKRRGNFTHEINRATITRVSCARHRVVPPGNLSKISNDDFSTFNFSGTVTASGMTTTGNGEAILPPQTSSNVCKNISFGCVEENGNTRNGNGNNTNNSSGGNHINKNNKRNHSVIINGRAESRNGIIEEEEEKMEGRINDELNKKNKNKTGTIEREREIFDLKENRSKQQQNKHDKMNEDLGVSINFQSIVSSRATTNNSRNDDGEQGLQYTIQSIPETSNYRLLRRLLIPNKITTNKNELESSNIITTAGACSNSTTTTTTVSVPLDGNHRQGRLEEMTKKEKKKLSKKKKANSLQEGRTQNQEEIHSSKNKITKILPLPKSAQLSGDVQKKQRQEQSKSQKVSAAIDSVLEFTTTGSTTTTTITASAGAGVPVAGVGGVKTVPNDYTTFLTAIMMPSNNNRKCSALQSSTVKPALRELRRQHLR